MIWVTQSTDAHDAGIADTIVVHADSFNTDIIVGMSEQNCQCSRKFKSIISLAESLNCLVICNFIYCLKIFTLLFKDANGFFSSSISTSFASMVSNTVKVVCSFFSMYDTLSCHPGTSSSRGPFQRAGLSSDKQWILR